MEGRNKFFEKITHLDTKREDILIEVMSDPLMTQLILFENFPELLDHEIDREETFIQVAMNHNVRLDVVDRAYEEGKAKFERIQDLGY